MRNSSNKGVDYYFDIIDGKSTPPDDLFSDEPPELRPGKILGYAFDMLEELLEEVNDPSATNRIIEYIDDNLDTYDPRKCLAIHLLGYIGDNNVELLVGRFINSKNPDLSYAALVSLCEMLERGVLSKGVADDHIERLSKMLSELNCSTEEAVECAKTLKKINYKNVDAMISDTEKRMPEFRDEFKSLLS
jgi:hypothetical protein